MTSRKNPRSGDAGGFSGITTDRFWGIACVGEEPLEHLDASSHSQESDPQFGRLSRSISAFIPDPQRKFLERYEGASGEGDFVAGELVAEGAIRRLGVERTQAVMGISRKGKREKRAVLDVLREQLGMPRAKSSPAPVAPDPGATQVILVQQPPPRGKS